MKQKSYAGKWLFMGIANTMPPGMDTLQVRKDTLMPTRHIRSILMLKDLLKSTEAANGLKFDYKYYHSDSHGTVPLITEYDALHFIFSYYAIPNEMMMKVYQGKLDAAVIGQIEAHYDMVSKQMGYRQHPPEATINQFAYNFMTRNPDAAFLLFSLNIQNHPGSFNVYDGMGDYYASVKNNAKAIEYYKKALALKEYKETRDKLNKLTSQ
ncbi:MAG TPA: hypothetical protein VHS53_14775 [Mucilaginibacter sp.]|nr:hypothetical protein [Mucilaginibacter sp.]